jgi:hypothetical protein
MTLHIVTTDPPETQEWIRARLEADFEAATGRRPQPYLPDDYADRLEQELDSCLLPRPLTPWEAFRLTVALGFGLLAFLAVLGALWS